MSDNMRKYSLIIAKIMLLCLIVGTVVFIFRRSTLPPEESTKESNIVGEIIEEIFPPETPVGGYVQKNLRKLAHFTEFFVLGLEVALYVSLFIRKKLAVLLSVPFGFIVGLCDETIQIFSGRGPSIFDVLIDFSGFLCAQIIIYTIAIIITVINTKCKQK